MIEQIKTYLVNTVLTKYLPIGAMSVFTVLGTFAAAHDGVLEKWGINYIPDWSAAWVASHAISGHVLLIELDTVTTATITLIVGLAAVAMRATEHHVATAGQPPAPAAPPEGQV